MKHVLLDREHVEKILMDNQLKVYLQIQAIEDKQQNSSNDDDKNHLPSQ